MSLLWRELDTRTDEWAESTAFEYDDKTFCPYSPFEVESKIDWNFFWGILSENGGILSKNVDILWRCVPVGYPHKHDLRLKLKWNKQPVLQLVHTPQMQPKRTTEILGVHKSKAKHYYQMHNSLCYKGTQRTKVKMAKHISVFVECHILHFHDNRIHFVLIYMLSFVLPYLYWICQIYGAFYSSIFLHLSAFYHTKCDQITSYTKYICSFNSLHNRMFDTIYFGSKGCALLLNISHWDELEKMVFSFKIQVTVYCAGDYAKIVICNL